VRTVRLKFSTRRDASDYYGVRHLDIKIETSTEEIDMDNQDSFFVRWTPRLLSVLRIIAGFLFIAHGAQKLFGFLAPPGSPTPPLMSLIGVGGVLEFFGGLLLLVGLFTRPVAFVLSGLMAVAYFMAHAPGGFWPLQNKGELAVLY
jgi:putative oxidoreductase